MKNKMKFVPLLILLVVIMLQVGYSVFSESLLISDVTAQVRLQENVRVTGIIPTGNSNDGLANSEDYNVKRIAMNLSLPNANSTVTYTVQVTNFGSAEMGIAGITGLPSNLSYDITPGVIGEMVCDTHGKCTLGAVKEFTITIKYGTYDSSNTTFDLYLDFDFRGYYNVTYINAPRGNSYKTKALKNYEFIQQYDPAGGLSVTNSSGTLTEGSNYTLANKTITINAASVISDLTIRFRPLGEYINKLYADGTKSTVGNGTNAVTYNRVTNLGLINDREGGNAEPDAGNVRYYGTNANNYIYYNCQNYDNQSSSTCEIWRIIGVFNGKVKIIRSSSIGNFAVDTNNNKWSDSDMKKLLNAGHDSESVNNSLYWNRGSGKCYTTASGLFQSVKQVDCDFTSTGLRDGDTKNFISDETIYFTSSSNALCSIGNLYKRERGEGSIYSGNDRTWTGKVSIPYPSDYYYSANLSNCTSDVYWLGTGCSNTSWMKQSSNMWTISPGASGSGNEWYIATAGGANYNDVYEGYAILPTLYMYANTIFVDGNGSSGSPFKIYPVAS